MPEALRRSGAMPVALTRGGYWRTRAGDWVPPGLIAVLAVALRLAFAFRAPPFYVGGDSETYLVPAFDLANGLGFAPILKRPPLFPAFAALSLAVLGEDLRGLALLQHGLGVLTVIGTYLLGRLVAGKAAGALAAVLVALNGGLLIYERYVMAETLFTTLLTWSMVCVTAGARRRSTWLLAAAGALLGGSALTRPTAQLLVPLMLLGLWPFWRPAAAYWHAAAAMLGAFLLVAGPWTAVTWAQSGSAGSGLGEALFWRGTRETPWRGEPYLIGREIGRPSDVSDPTLQAARRLAYQRAQEDDLPSDIAALIRQRFGYSEAEADHVLRDVALELFARQPGRYAITSLGLFGRLLQGTEQWLGGQGKTGGIERYANPQDKYGEWWEQRIRHLAQPATVQEANEFRRAQALASLYQPYRFAAVILPLQGLGLVALAVAPAWRLGLLPVGMAAWLLLATAFLSGALPRYRYPADPLLALTLACGIVGLLLGMREAGRRMFQARSASQAAPSPTSTSPSATVGR
ncbi:MAG: glycosyltransferase family 39 protein [Chloroflexota bacterium]